MVLLEEKLSKFYSKLENHHNHHKEDDEEALSAALRVFRSKVSNFLKQLLLNLKPRSGNLPFSWIRRSLELLPMIEKAFAKLIMEIDYPMSKWEAASVEEYLNYSLDMLDVLNLISSSVSHLGHARLLLSYALTVKKTEALKPIELKIPVDHVRKGEKKAGFDAKRFGSRKETAIHQALAEVKTIGFYVCGVVLFSLCRDAKPYLEIKKLASGSSDSSLKDFDLGVFDGRSVVLKELKEVNEATASLVAYILNGNSRDEDAEELTRKLKELEKVTEELGQMVDQLFSSTLAGRSHLLNAIRTA